MCFYAYSIYNICLIIVLHCKVSLIYLINQTDFVWYVSCRAEMEPVSYKPSNQQYPQRQKVPDYPTNKSSKSMDLGMETHIHHIYQKLPTK